MFAALLMFAVTTIADQPAQGEATALKDTVQVRFVYTVKEGETSKGIEPWIVKKLAEKEDNVIVSMSDWVPLKREDQRVCSGNGFYIDGKAKLRDDTFVVKLSGCAGGGLKRNARIKPGEQAVYLVKGTRTIFVAIRTMAPIAEKPGE